MSNIYIYFIHQKNNLDSNFKDCHLRTLLKTFSINIFKAYDKFLLHTNNTLN